MTITGSAFNPNAVVTLTLTDPSGTQATWTATSDGSGSFTTTYQIDGLGGTYYVSATDGLNTASTTFTDSIATLWQCTNGGVGNPPEPCAGSTLGAVNGYKNYVNGNANAAKAHWREGEFVAYRTIIATSTTGTYVLQIHYDTVHGGEHAFDYLGSFDYTETTSSTPTFFHANNNNPCGEVTGIPCNPSSPASSFLIPSAILANCATSAGTIPSTEVPGSFKIWGNGNPVITGVSYVAQNVVSGTGQCSTSIAVAFSVSGTGTVVLAWGAHIASELDWGAGNSATSISGSPYHVALDQITINGVVTTIGSQDAQLSASAVVFTPTISTTIKDANGNVVTSVFAGTTIHDTATLTGASSNAGGSVTYSLFNNGACSGTPASTQTVTVTSAIVPDSSPFTPSTPGSYSYQAAYSGNNGPPQNLAATSSCEPFTVTQRTSLTSTTVFDTGTIVANAGGTSSFTALAHDSFYDAATVTVSGATPTGTVTYHFFADSSCGSADEVTTGGWPYTVTLASGNVPNSQATGPLAAGSYSFQAVYSGDSNYLGSTGSCEPFNVSPTLPPPPPTVSKTVSTSFTRTYSWTITKSVDTPSVFTAGGASVTVHYTVSVTGTAVDSGFHTSGVITVTGSTFAFSGLSLTDTDSNGGSCTVATGSLGDSPASFSLAAGATETFGYTCTFSSSPGSGTNTATVSWPDEGPFTFVGSDGLTHSTGTLTAGSASSSPVSYTFGSPATSVGFQTVTVTDTLGGSLGPCSAPNPSSPLSTNPSSHTCNFVYPITFADPTGTCTTHANTATIVETAQSAGASVKDCQGSDLTVSKTATPTNSWTISKSVDQTRVNIAAGGSATFTYTIVADSSGWQVSGSIVVSNPNDWESITANVADAVDNGGVCTVTGGTGVVIAASSSVTLSYTCTYSSYPTAASGTNTATATWDNVAASTPDGSASGTAGFTFKSVTVSDTRPDGTTVTLGSCDVTGKCTFSDTFTTGGVAGTCSDYTNTATIVETSATASKTVTVCVGKDLTVSKNATPFFTRTFAWDISKSVDKTTFDIAQGGTATFNYVVSVTHDGGTDSAWMVTGTITVTNPNDWEAITANVADVVDNGGVCTVTGGTGVSVPASSSVNLSYSCTYSSAPTSSSGTNTATATWDSTAFFTPSGSASGNAGFAFVTPTTIVDGSVTVTDTLGGSLGTVFYTDPSPTTFGYSHTFSGDPAGTCTTHDNTATFTTSDTGTTGSAGKTVAVCVGEDLTVSKTATPTFTRTFTWEIAKSVDNSKIFTAGGSAATFNYLVTVSHDAGTDSAWAITGTITVTNPNDWEAITFTLADVVNNGGSCVIAGGTGPFTVAASGSATYSYSCTFPTGASGTNTATASWDAATYFTPDGTASGSATFAFTTPTTIADGSVNVVDSLKGALGTVSYTDPSPTTFSYSLTFSDPAGTCTSHSNTATFTTDTSQTTGSASQTVTDCQGADLTVSKTANPFFTRTFTWGITKTADSLTKFTAGGATATFLYTISVTHDSGADSAWVVTGTITVTNPNDWESITATVTDSIAGGACTVNGGSNVVTVKAGGSVTLPYTCTFTSNPGSATNTATATWDASAASTPDGSASGSAPFAFDAPTTIVDGSVVVSDTIAGILGTVSYTDPSPTTFTYSSNVDGPAGVCTPQSNTASFTTDDTGATGSSSVTVQDCQGADLTVSKTATPTFTRTYTWSIAKYCDSPTDSSSNCVLNSATAPFNVVVTNTGFVDSAWALTGTITVTNPNNWESVTFTLSDPSCTIAGGSGPYTIAAGATLTFSYSCSLSSGASGTNTATATWDASVASTPDGSASGSAGFSFDTPTTTVNSQVTVTDTFQGQANNNLGTCTVAQGSCTFADTRTISFPTAACQSFTNSASVIGDNKVVLGTATSTVTACPPGFVTDTSFCPINQNTANLIYVQTSGNTYQLKASNPGQFYYNVFYTATPGTSFTLTITLPFPFITQGAHPIQTSSSFQLNTGGLCISPSFDNPVTGITTAGGSLSTAGYPVVVLSDYSPQAMGSTTTITVTGTVPTSGLVYVTVHMDYGLKGQYFNKGTTLQTFGTQTGYAAIGSTTSTAIINFGQAYHFSTSGALTTTFTLNSVNTFKKDPGFGGVVTDGTGTPLANVKVVITFSGQTFTVYTDSDGYYSLQYKYTGSATPWTVKATYNGATQTQTGTIKSNQLVIVNFVF